MEFFNNTENVSGTRYDQETSTMTMVDICILPLAQGTILVVVNTLLSIVGTFGNMLIIMAVVRSPRLRQKPSNFLLLSLAVADLLVTMVAQPLFTASISMKTFTHRCHHRIDILYVIAAPIAGTSSVFHLAAISIDRSLSALMPHKHRDIMKKGLKIMLVICWGLSALCVCILVLNTESNFAVYITLLLCLVIMIIAYGMILYKILATRVVNVPVSTARDRAMEKRVSGTVAIIIALFAICWVPLIAFHLSKSTTSQATYWWIRTLYLANSSMNFIVYSLRIKQFRTAFLKIINRCLRKFGKLLPQKCRCQCVDSFSARNFSQNTQHTPVSPLSTTAAPVPMTLVRKSDRESLVLQIKSDANKYIIQGKNNSVNQQGATNIVRESKELKQEDRIIQKEKEEDDQKTNEKIQKKNKEIINLKQEEHSVQINEDKTENYEKSDNENEIHLLNVKQEELNHVKINKDLASKEDEDNMLVDSEQLDKQNNLVQNKNEEETKTEELEEQGKHDLLQNELVDEEKSVLLTAIDIEKPHDGTDLLNLKKEMVELEEEFSKETDELKDINSEVVAEETEGNVKKDDILQNTSEELEQEEEHF